MMHLEAIIERDERPARQPHPGTTARHDANARYALDRARSNKRPWEASDPLPDSEAHPHGLHECEPIKAPSAPEIMRNLAPSIPLVFDMEDKFTPK